MAFRKIFLSSLLLLFHFFQSCVAIDTITPDQLITDGKLIISSGGNFALGFFSPGKSSNRYLGIWYNKIPEQTVVWVANRDIPLKRSNGILKFDSNGNLALYDRYDILWSTNASFLANSSIANLLDSGNLIITDVKSKIIKWESFNYPTNTYLPGMKIGLNLKTGFNRFLTSWKSSDNPAPGDYTFKLDPSGSPEFLLCKGTISRWRSGPWDGEALNGVPEMTRHFIFNYDFTDSPDEIFMLYTIYNSSIFSRFFLNELGVLQRSTWIDKAQKWNTFWSGPRDKCDNYAQCGAYGSCNSNAALECSCLPGFTPKFPRDWYLRDGSNGCVRKRNFFCGSGEGFLKMTRVKVPDTSRSVVYKGLNLKDCESKCLKNCSCKAHTVAGITGCITWYGDLTDIQQFSDGGHDIFLRVDAVELAANTRTKPKNGLHRKRTLIFLSLSIMVAVLILGLSSYLLFKKIKKRRLSREDQSSEILMLTSSQSYKGSPHPNDRDASRGKLELPFYDLGVVVSATANFSLANKLGQGGFGLVYKGQLFNGQEVAVKRLSNNSGQGTEEFKNEVTLIAKLQHRNLVRLLGCCVQDKEKILIYEYLPNKSLDFFIFDQSKSSLLDWRKRFKIILGTARGVLYLHQDSRLRIIHRDLKASNVLLDAEMNPKISDFGMARIFGGNQTQAETIRVVGTYGYMSPEYAMDGLFSTKSDVFSFGVLILEIISGKRNSGFYYTDPSMNLLAYTWNLWQVGRAVEIIDSSMGAGVASQEVLKCIQVGLLCVQENAADRPTMSNIIFMLDNETTMPSIKQPAFILRNSSRDQDSSSTGTSTCSVNDMTITAVECR